MRRKIVVLYFLISSLSLAIDKGRSEIERFHILNDRKISDKFLLDSSNQYFYIDTEASSKLIKLFGDVSNTESSSSEADQVTDITEILTSELNTEKYLNLHIDAQLPLIPFNFKDFKFLPGVFAEFHLGTSLSIDNEQNALVPEVNLYAMNQVRYGIQSLIKHPSIRDAQFKIRVYKNSIKDLEVSKNSTEIAQNDAIVDLDELEKQEVTYKTDISFHKEKKRYSYIIEVKDLKFMSAAASEKESLYGSTPLLHFAYQSKFLVNQKYKAKTTFGLAHRNRYDIPKGLYFGLGLDFREQYPLHIQTKIDSQFLTFWLGTKFKYLNFYYGLKMAYKNPQNNLWVPSIHRINIGIPF